MGKTESIGHVTRDPPTASAHPDPVVTRLHWPFYQAVPLSTTPHPLLKKSRVDFIGLYELHLAADINRD